MTQTESLVFLQKASDAKLQVTQVQQWLQDISATRAEKGFDDGFAEAEKQAQAFRLNLQSFKEMFQNENDQEKLQLVEEVNQNFANFYKIGKVMAQTYIDKGPTGGNAFMPQFDEVAEKLHGSLNILVADQQKEAADSMAAILSDLEMLSKMIIISASVGIIFGLSFWYYLNSSICLLLRKMVLNLSNSSDQVSSAANEISNSSIQLSQGASTQAAALEQTSATIEELNGQTKSNADAANLVAEAMQAVLVTVKNSHAISTEAASLSNLAKDSAQKGVNSMSEISASMGKVSSISNKVSDIIQIINEITHQTKMLSTNAAIEAARAGEHGKGFAVVADEVSKLAMSSKTAAKEISSLIKENVKSAQEGHEKAQSGETVLHEINAQSAKVAIMMEEAVMAAKAQAQKIESLTEEISGIKVASTEQALAVSEVSRTIVEIEGVTQENASSSEQAASAAEELSAQAHTLSDLIEEVASQVDISEKKNGSNQKTGFAAKGSMSSMPHIADVEEIKGDDFWPKQTAPQTKVEFSGF